MQERRRPRARRQVADPRQVDEDAQRVRHGRQVLPRRRAARGGVRGPAHRRVRAQERVQEDRHLPRAQRHRQARRLVRAIQNLKNGLRRVRDFIL